MKHSLSIILAVMLFAIGGKSFAAEWNIDNVHSNVGFQVKHLVVSTVHGRFTDFSGTINLDPKDLSTTNVNFTAQVASVTTDNEGRDNHLKGADFFDAEKHPMMSFQSKKATVIESGKTELAGDLTIRGVTKEVVFTVEGFNTPIEFMGTTKIGGSAAATINRQDFGVSWNKALDAGGVVVGDEVKIVIELELNQK